MVEPRYRGQKVLSGRMQFYVDHAWMLELGEGLPVFRPPLYYRAIFGDQGAHDGW
jgi:nitrate reductase alpha subunit